MAISIYYNIFTALLFSLCNRANTEDNNNNRNKYTQTQPFEMHAAKQPQAKSKSHRRQRRLKMNEINETLWLSLKPAINKP